MTTYPLTITHSHSHSLNRTPIDGFAFVIQNDRIKNMNGNTARALAFNDIAKSIAVAIHVCPGDGITCETPDVRVEVHDDAGDTVTGKQVDCT